MRLSSRAAGCACGLPIALLCLTALVDARAHYVRLEGELRTPGVLTFGVAPAGPPFAFRQDGRMRGFEIEVAQAVAEALGLELEVRELRRKRLHAALAAGEIDAVSTLALEEATGELRVMPYLVLGDHLMVLRGNPYRVGALEDLAGRTVAVTMGTSAEAFAHDLNGRFAESGREPMDVHSLPAQHLTHVPVSMGHAAAYFLHTVSAVGVSRDPHARTELLEGAFRPRREAGFAVPAARENLFHAIEHAMAGMVATGRYERLRERHALPPELSPYR